MKDSFEEMHNLIEADYQNSAWSRDCDFKKRIKEFLDETEEIKKAVENDNFENLKEEIGDALWDLVYVIHTGEQEGLFKSKDILNNVITKIKRRKPWALEGKQLSKEEELRVWNEVKEKEKKGEFK